MPSCRRATYSRKLFSGFLAVPVPAKGPPLPRTLRLPSRAVLRWSDMWSALTLCPWSNSAHCGRGAMFCCSPTDVCCWRHQNLMQDESSRRSGSRLKPRNFRGGNARKQERSRPKNVARRPGRYQPCRRLGRERFRHANPKPPVGPLTSTRDRIRALVRTSVVLVSPCGSGVLHRMGQRPPVLRHSQRIASIEPPLAERTPGNAIGIERPVSRCASSAIGHVRP